MSVAPRPHGRALPEAASRRGWCPGLTRPMPTGDGLLARVHPPLGVLTLGQARAVAEGARRFGNGHLDLTARANLQIRGVTEATQASLAAWLSAQGLGDVRADGGPQRLTLTSPLAGRDPEEAIDVPGLARAVEAAGLTIPGLPAKTLVVIEGRVDRATAEADCAVIANAPGRVAITIACGEGRQDLLTCGEREAPDVVAAVLTAFARTGRRRMRDLSEDERATLTEALRSGKRPHVAARGGESVWPGQARQPRGGQDLQILAIDAPFGRSTADALDRLADAALTLDADELRLSPTRGFMLLAPRTSRQRRCERPCRWTSSLPPTTRGGRSMPARVPRAAPPGRPGPSPMRRASRRRSLPWRRRAAPRTSRDAPRDAPDRARPT